MTSEEIEELKRLQKIFPASLLPAMAMGERLNAGEIISTKALWEVFLKEQLGFWINRKLGEQNE